LNREKTILCREAIVCNGNYVNEKLLWDMFKMSQFNKFGTCRSVSAGQDTIGIPNILFNLK